MKSNAHSPHRWGDFLWVSLLALLVRCVLLIFTGPHLYGDGIGYPHQGMLIATGQGVGPAVDATWLGAISFWMAGVYLLVRSVVWAGIVGAFLPGMLLVSLVQLTAHRICGRLVGILAGIFCALHPLLATYSINGYMEMFYCAALMIATVSAVTFLQRESLEKSKVLVVVSGVALAVVFATRNEALPLALAFLALPIFARGGFRQRGVAMGWGALGFLLTLLVYVGISMATTDQIGLFGKMGNFSRESDMYLEREAAASEIYGRGGILEQVRGDSPAVEEEAVGMQVSTLLERFFSKAFKVLPGVAIQLFASPLPLFAAIPILGWIVGRGWRREYLPVCLVVLFFPLFFTAYALEPRYLMPMLMPVHFLAALGMVQLSEARLWKRFSRPILVTAVGLTSLVLCAGMMWKGGKMQRERDLHKNLAEWLREEVAADQIVTGCGFGYITASTFRSGHPSFSRLHTDDVDELATFVSERTDGWLILYEAYMADANPKLLRYLDEPLPGFEVRHEVTDNPGLRARIFQRVATPQSQAAALGKSPEA